MGQAQVNLYGSYNIVKYIRSMYFRWMLTLPFNRTHIAVSTVKLRHDVQLENHPTASSVYWHDRLPILGCTAQNIFHTQKGRVVGLHKHTKYTNFGLACDIAAIVKLSHVIHHRSCWCFSEHPMYFSVPKPFYMPLIFNYMYI